MLADESEPYIDILDFSDFSHSIFSGNKFDTNNLLQNQSSISLNNISTPKDSNRLKCRSVSDCNLLSLTKKKEGNNNKKQEQLYIATDINPEETAEFDLAAKYNQALKDIESLKTEITKLKSTTPVIICRKNSQSSMIKTCLFKNSSTAIRRTQLNLTKTSLFGADSTCMTIDVEDGSPQTDKEQMNEYVIVNNKNRNCNLEVSGKSANLTKETNDSSSPLFVNYTTRNSTMNKIRGMFNNFMKCPQFLYKLKSSKKNRRFYNQVTPVIPRVTIISPKTSSGRDSGNNSEEQQIKLYDLKSNEVNSNAYDTLIEDRRRTSQKSSMKQQKPLYFRTNVSHSTRIFYVSFHELLCENMKKLAEELAEKFNTFKYLLEQFSNCKPEKI